MNAVSSFQVQAQQIQAIALTVADSLRARDFYTRAFGFEPIDDVIVEGQDYADLEGTLPSRIRIVTLALGDERIRLMQYLDLQGRPIPPDSRSNDLWFQHLAIVVSDMDRAYAHLQAFPIEAISTAPQTIPPDNQEAAGIRAFKFRDPDRHPLELIWFPPGKGQEKWCSSSDRLFLGIDHTAIAVASTAQSLRFYRDILGMQVAGGSHNWRTTQSRLDGLPSAEVQITALRPAQGGMGIELLEYCQPMDGRPIPPDWKSCDVAHTQIELVVNDLSSALNQLQQHQVPQVSGRVVPINHRFIHPPGSYPLFHQACLVKDPTGHSVLLAAV